MKVEDAGIGDWKGPEDKQAFIVGFFRANDKPRSRKKRGAKRPDDISFNDYPDQGPYNAS